MLLQSETKIEADLRLDEIHFLRVSLKTPLASFIHFRNYIFKINMILKRDFDYSIRSQSIAAFQPDLMKVNRPRTIRMFCYLQNYSVIYPQEIVFFS